MKNIYFVNECDEGNGYAVVAESHNEAKTFAMSETMVDYIDLRAKIKKKNVSFPKGIFEDYEYCLKNEIFSYVEESECPNCKSDWVTVYYEKGRGFYCSSCEEEE